MNELLVTVREKKLCCSLHKMSDLQQSLAEGRAYYALVCIPENVIYQRPATILPKTQSKKMFQVIHQSKQEFEAGLAKAKNFYDGARYYRETREPSLAMFMLQQATELTFRTIAISMYGIEKRTHSISSLKRFNRRLAPQLNDIFPGDTLEEERILRLLEDAYLDSRYTPGYTVESADLDTIVRRVQQLLEVAHTAFEERIRIIERSPADLS